MKAVVTGGAGFIGCNLAQRLLTQGHEVHIVDDLATGNRANLPPGATFHHGSILDAAVLDQAFKGADVVFHEAALPRVSRSIENPMRSNEVNVTGTLEVLQAARRHAVGKLVYASSSSAYGDTPTLPKVESMPTTPQSPYAVSKLTAEMYCRVFHRVYGLRTTALRYFNVYGPQQDPNGAYAAVIPKFILLAQKGEAIPIHGDGTQTRDFTYVADIVEANLLAAKSTKADGQAMNIGAGGRTSLNELARLVLKATGSASKIVHEPPRLGDVHDSLAGLELARELIGYQPRTPIADGVPMTVRWFKKNLGTWSAALARQSAAIV